MSRALRVGYSTVFTIEFIHSTGAVNEFLFPREKGVTLRANFNREIALRGAGFNDSPAGTNYFCVFILRMNFFLHDIDLYLKNSKQDLEF